MLLFVSGSSIFEIRMAYLESLSYAIKQFNSVNILQNRDFNIEKMTVSSLHFTASEEKEALKV